MVYQHRALAVCAELRGFSVALCWHTPALGTPLLGSLAQSALGKGFPESHILRRHHQLPQCGHTTPEGQLLDCVPRATWAGPVPWMAQSTGAT